MVYSQFTAQELYCMAKLCKKKAMFGIPDGFELLSDEERPQAQLEVMDSLLSKQITRMDLDGKTVFAYKAYRELISAICDCDACLTVNSQIGADRSEDIVFWSSANGILRAEVIEDRFVFGPEDAAGVKAYLSAVILKSRSSKAGLSATIPQIVLANAKRRVVDKKEEDARRMLLQNGADVLTDAILTGLQEKADYLGLLLMVNKPTEQPPQQAAFLCAGDILLSLSDKVVSYRNCTVFSACSENDAAVQIQSLLDQFLSIQKEAQ